MNGTKPNVSDNSRVLDQCGEVFLPEACESDPVDFIQKMIGRGLKRKTLSMTKSWQSFPL
jgi:hypothetical protein